MNSISPNASSGKRRGFTMIELLIVISVIGIMSALIISAFSNAAQDTRRVVARQQQAAVQNSVNAWVTYRASQTGLADAKITYNAAATSLGRLNLVGNYLEDSTLDHFISNTTNSGQVVSGALKKTGQYLQLGTWADNSYPKVELK